jgi:2-dehydro-3-deoxygalactonokinase
MSETCYIAVDLGTTNTRLWLMRGTAVLERVSALVGVRDTARTGNNLLLREQLRESIGSLEQSSRKAGLSPSLVIGAGMLTSNLGLLEVPHVEAPAGLLQIRHRLVSAKFEDITHLPFYLAPGVRYSNQMHGGDPETVSDVMRGEETLCIGLISIGVMVPGVTLLNLGSHWKAIQVNHGNEIVRSYTDLGGELIFAVQNHTVLTGSLPEGRLSELDRGWLGRGVVEENHSGLSRAMFRVRLLDLGGDTTAQQRFSFLVGAVIAHSMRHMDEAGMLEPKVVVCGSSGIAQAWEWALQAKGRTVVNYSEHTDEAFLRGISDLVTSLL